MRRVLLATAAVLMLAPSAFAAPNVTNVTQKGSLLIFPQIFAPPPNAGNFGTLIRLQNDGSSDVDVKCYWMDGFKNRVDFIIPLTRSQAVWFDASSGRGTFQVNPFPTGAANGFTAGNRHPFLDDSPFVLDGAPGDGFGIYNRGMLACWAVDGGAQNQLKWNHLSGTATIYGTESAFEYNAYAFYVPTGTDLGPVGVGGTLNLNGLEYDACPLYQIGQFTPAGAVPPAGAPEFTTGRLTVVGCNLNLNQDWTPVWTKLQLDVWNEEEVKFTGAFECADSWHETRLNAGATPQNNGAGAPAVPGFIDGLDAAGQNFAAATLGTYAARYRIQGVKSTQCDRVKSGSSDTVAAVTTQAVGVLAVHQALLNLTAGAGLRSAGTTLAAAGKFNGKVVWDPEGVVPEGGLK